MPEIHPDDYGDWPIEVIAGVRWHVGPADPEGIEGGLRVACTLPEPEGWQVLAQDLASLDSAQYRQVAEWMIEHGWTEPLDPVESLRSRILGSMHSIYHFARQIRRWQNQPGLNFGDEARIIEERAGKVLVELGLTLAEPVEIRTVESFAPAGQTVPDVEC